MKTAVNLFGVGMRGWIIAPSGLIEPVPAPEIRVDGIGAIEAISGDYLRYYLFQETLPLESALAPAQRIVVAKIDSPISIVPMSISQLAQCVIRDGNAPIVGKPRLVT